MESELKSFGLSLKHITVHVMTAEHLVTSRFGLRTSRHLWLLGQMSCQSNIIQRRPQMASAFVNLVQQRLLFLHLPGHTWRLHFPASFAATLTIPLGSGHKAPTLTFDTFFFLFGDKPWGHVLMARWQDPWVTTQSKPRRAISYFRVCISGPVSLC